MRWSRSSRGRKGEDSWRGTGGEKRDVGGRERLVSIRRQPLG